MTTQKEAREALDTLPASPKGLYEEYHSRLDIIRSYIEQSDPAKIREETLDEVERELINMLNSQWAGSVISSKDAIAQALSRIRSLRDQEGEGDGCHCHLCGRDYPKDFIVPNEIWNRIRPVEGSDEGGGLLCATCIVSRLEKMDEFASFTIICNPADGSDPIVFVPRGEDAPEKVKPEDDMTPKEKALKALDGLYLRMDYSKALRPSIEYNKQILFDYINSDSPLRPGLERAVEIVKDIGRDDLFNPKSVLNRKHGYDTCRAVALHTVVDALRSELEPEKEIIEEARYHEEALDHAQHLAVDRLKYLDPEVEKIIESLEAMRDRYFDLMEGFGDPEFTIHEYRMGACQDAISGLLKWFPIPPSMEKKPEKEIGWEDWKIGQKAILTNAHGEPNTVGFKHHDDECVLVGYGRFSEDDLRVEGWTILSIDDNQTKGGEDG